METEVNDSKPARWPTKTADLACVIDCRISGWSLGAVCGGINISSKRAVPSGVALGEPLRTEVKWVIKEIRVSRCAEEVRLNNVLIVITKLLL